MNFTEKSQKSSEANIVYKYALFHPLLSAVNLPGLGLLRWRRRQPTQHA